VAAANRRSGRLDCGDETICESCDFFTTGHAFRPTLQAQHDDAAAKGQLPRQQLFTQLLAGLNEGVS
jgi:hypothetical protein